MLDKRHLRSRQNKTRTSKILTKEQVQMIPIAPKKDEQVHNFIPMGIEGMTARI